MGKGAKMKFTDYMLIYLGIISLVTVIVTAADKSRSKKKRSRVPENALITLALVGGSLAEYLTMKIIRHKTKKKKFMLGLPIIFICQVILIYFIFRACGQL